MLDADIDALREMNLAPKFNYGAPRVRVRELHRDGSLVLDHDASVDGRGLDLERSRKVMEYIHSVWRRPLSLMTVDEEGAYRVLEYPEGKE